MISGPKPKPTALKKLSGRSHHKQNKKEPSPLRLTSVPPAPRWLGIIARAKWKELAKDLCALGLLTKIDQDALARFCVVYQRWREAEEKIKEEGEVITTQTGYPIQSPWLMIANKCVLQLNAIGSEFGLSPSSRTRVEIAPPHDEQDKLEQELFGRPVRVIQAIQPKKNPSKEKQNG